MKIDFIKENGVLNVQLEGRLDTLTSSELDNFFRDNLVGVNEVIIDCANLVYVSSAGLRVLLSTHKKMKEAMKLKNVQDLVLEVFEITGFVDFLVIE
jgi:anti-sigma B factor antagonist